jgi:hypothetical protein
VDKATVRIDVIVHPGLKVVLSLILVNLTEQEHGSIVGMLYLLILKHITFSVRIVGHINRSLGLYMLFTLWII